MSCPLYQLLLVFLLHFSLNATIPSVSELSLEEKVGQVLMVHFLGEQANEEACHLIQELHVGGIIYYTWANGLNDPLQVQHLSQGLQKLAEATPHHLPLFISTDQEGGCVTRLRQGFTQFPGNYALGMAGNWDWGRECARMMAEELRAVGINLNLAPVVDVYTCPTNPVIGIRAFSTDPKAVVKWGSYSLAGYKRAGLLAAIKHFPGHGDVKVDSHATLPVIGKTREELDQVDLLPFRSLANEAEMILTAHLKVPALDTKECVTFSKTIIQDLLRNEFKFQGIVMTDSLVMEGILSQCASVEEAALKSLQAGHDLILLGGKQLLTTQKGFELTVDDIKRIHRYLVDAVRTGRLAEQRLNEAVLRILALKEKYHLFDFTFPSPDSLKEKVGSQTHLALAKQIARGALSVVKGKPYLPKQLLLVAPECLKGELEQTSWNRHAHIIYFKDVDPDAVAIKEIRALAATKTSCLLFAYNAWQYKGQQQLFQHLRAACPTLFAVIVRDPLDQGYFSSADLTLCTYSPTISSLQAAYDYLSEGNEGE